jgi:hypothetical protein
MLGSFSIPNSHVLDRFQPDFLLRFWQLFEKTVRHLRDTLGRFAFLGEFGIRCHLSIISRVAFLMSRAYLRAGYLGTR